MKTIKITPTWSGLIRPMIQVLENPKADSQSKRVIEDELIRLAKIADSIKTEANQPEWIIKD